MSWTTTEPPFGLAPLIPAFARATRLAKALFSAFDASIVLKDGERLWRSRHHDHLGGADAGLTHALDSGESLWVEDARREARYAADPAVTGAVAMRFYASAPIRLADGAIIGVLCVISRTPRPYDAHLAERLRDIADTVADECNRLSELQAAERGAAELEMAGKREAALFSTLPVALMMTDRDFRVLKASPFWLRDFGVEEADVLGRCVFDFAPEYFLPFKSAFEKVLTGRPIKDGRLRSEHNGVVQWLQAELTPWRDRNGEIGGVIACSHQITELVEVQEALVRAKEEAESANVTKGVFLATMSHEIRTPLNGVLGMAQAMSAEGLSEVQRDRLDVIRQSGESLLAILNDILDFSKIEAGKLEIETIAFDLAEIAQGAHAAFTAIANKKGLSFALDVQGAEGVYLGDPTRIRQILYNLISNALKFTEAGEIRTSAAYADGRLDIFVADSGIGMSEVAVAGLFQKFNQADASTTRRFGGTGLGLAVCKELSTLMGGSISVESALGQGSTFRVNLPLARIGEARDPNAGSGAVEGEATTIELRVLAAEDNAINQLVLKTLLHQIGVEPLIVGNGALALEAWESGDWDVVLMDVQMPVMDGPATVRAIRAREAQTGRPRTPILALTANAMNHQVADYLAGGMDGHLAKPIEASKLYEALQAVLEQKVETAPRRLA